MKEGLGSKLRPKGRKNHACRPCGPCRIGGKPLYQPQLIVSYDRVLRVGPFRTRSFLLAGRARRKRCLVQAARPDRRKARPQPNAP